MMNYAAIIKDKITMPDVLTMYGVPVNKHRRIPCPLHGGKNDNFSFNDSVYLCFTCGEKGDVVTFVEKFFGLSFPEACEKLNKDFGLNLPIGRLATVREKQDYTEIIKRMRQREEERKLKARAARIMYDEALANVELCEDTLRRHRPKKGADRLDWQYVWALDNVERYRYEKNFAEEMIDFYDE